MSLVKSELKAKDVMTADPVCVPRSARIRELARVFEEHEISGVPVTDQHGKVIGVVTKTDLIRRCAEGTEDIPPAYLFEVLSEQGVVENEASGVIPEPLVCVEDFMTENPLTVGPDLSAAAVARMMFEKRVHHVIVADDEKFPIGIITSMDLLGVLPQAQ
ncbi:MAG: CBS domain-containing protein [Phycisphaeraceae bacterium]|nr:CBS domain-containing protein [Phycisphaeraceae bacterium]